MRINAFHSRYNPGSLTIVAKRQDSPVRDQPDANASPQDARAEASRILTRSLANATIDQRPRLPREADRCASGFSQQYARARVLLAEFGSLIVQRAGLAPSFGPKALPCAPSRRKRSEFSISHVGVKKALLATADRQTSA